MRRFAALFALCLLAPAGAQYAGWQHSGTLTILTTPEGANLPATASETDFPLLVRLSRDWFDFAQARPDGADLRFAAAGTPLPYQLEAWDPAGGTAGIWVRIPQIKGNARQDLKLFWGKADAASESNGAAVFNDSNGYVCVWHMQDPVKDEVGSVPSKDTGTTAATGVVGPARHFEPGRGVFCGDKLTNLPSGDSPHTTSLWVRAERVNTHPMNWGNEGGGRGSKIRVLIASPPRLRIECDFSDCAGTSTFPMNQWVHVVHTFQRGDRRVYLNGQLDGRSANALNIKSPARLWLGGWYNNYNFLGDLDEVRLSKVSRSADWVKLEYENQNPLQTLVGPLVQPGTDLSLSPRSLTVAEGQTATVTARAGGAQKLYWVLKRAGRERVVAVDRLECAFNAGRVVGDETATLTLKAVYPTETKTLEVPVRITEAIAEPEFRLAAPATWDGRSPIEVVPTITRGGTDLHYAWSVDGLAVSKSFAAGRLLLDRAQNSGTLTVTLALDNGGDPTTHTASIAVREPAADPWQARTPGDDEQPEDNQFIPRDNAESGTLWCTGKLAQPADEVFLRVYADDQLAQTVRGPLGAERSYRLSAQLKAGLIHYRTEFGAKAGGTETVLARATNLVCGDAYLIDGQSNALATDFGGPDPPYTNEWVRTFGSPNGDPRNARSRVWTTAICRARDGRGTVGYWGLELGKRLVETQKLPICILNGAVGGTRIDMHQRNAADPEDVSTIYGRLLWRVRQARLTHGIRAVLWHQGENDQGADGPTGRFGWETYRQFFIDMAAGWKRDYPNVGHYYVFQIWPKACAMGVDGSDNMLREVQRNLGRDFSRLDVLSTLGIQPPGGCHYPFEGWAQFATLVMPLLQRDTYGRTFAQPITPPNLRRALWTDAKHDRLTLEFDQPVTWNDNLTGQFYLDGAKDQVRAGSVAGNTLTLELRETSTAKTITYLDSKNWSQARLLVGANGLAALTFCGVTIGG